VRIWNVVNVSNSFGTYNTLSGTAGMYAAGMLYKNIRADESGKQTIEFKDKEQKVILKKVQLSAAADAGAGSGYSGWLCTYYIYDNLNNLRCVIQPRGVELIAANWLLSDETILGGQCFRYEYDLRNRMITKKIPGAGSVNMVYDARDRLVMTQDAGLLAQGKWMVMKYDKINRPVESGLWNNTAAAATHRLNASASASYPLTTSPYEQLTITHYDDYSNIPGGLDKAFDNTWSSNFITPYNTSPLYCLQPGASGQTTGLITWSQVKVLATASTWLYTATIYDDKGRPVQVKSTNLTGGLDITTTQYNWAGQPLIIVNMQSKAGTPAQTSVIISKLSYDELGRLIKTEKKLSNTLANANVMSPYATISAFRYDALGQMVKKTLGSKAAPATPGTP